MKTPEKTKAAQRKYRLSHPERIKATKKRYRLSNPEKIYQDNIEYRLKNKEWLRTYRRTHSRLEYQTNPDYKIRVTLRNRITKVLRGTLKSATTFALLGCSFEVLKSHLESKFIPGMTWENHGPVWHVDHIRPCISFDLTDAAQQRACFHYTNLQPLFARDNLIKGSKYASGF